MFVSLGVSWNAMPALIVRFAVCQFFRARVSADCTRDGWQLYASGAET
jgi:hypothetical protein